VRPYARLLLHGRQSGGVGEKSRTEEQNRGVPSASSRKPTTTGPSMQSDSRYVREAEPDPADATLPPRAQASSSKLDAALVIWRTLQASLSPIIGHRGVAALLRRSLYLTRDAHPWLIPVSDTAAGQDLLAPLQSALLLQDEADAMAAHGALLGNFRDLLTTLVGESLTERLLRPVLDNTSSGAAAQDTSQ
jgi:hypothetical protein